MRSPNVSRRHKGAAPIASETCSFKVRTVQRAGRSFGPSTLLPDIIAASTETMALVSSATSSIPTTFVFPTHPSKDGEEDKDEGEEDEEGEEDKDEGEEDEEGEEDKGEEG